jgi:hypothetical protein
MKKQILKSNFHEEDGMFFHNKVFRALHGYLRRTNRSIQIGMSKQKEAFYLYGAESDLADFMQQKEVANIVNRNVYRVSLVDVEENEPVLLRVNSHDPRKKAQERVQYFEKKFGTFPSPHSEFADLNEIEAHYKNQLNRTQDIYFITLKDDKPLSIYAQHAYLNPKECKPNTYGLSKRITSSLGG